MASTVPVKPELIRWAVERSGLPRQQLADQFPHLREWQSGARLPTLKQLEKFAKRTMTPLGYLFLPEPPAEELPLPDFRRVDDRPLGRPSPNLLDTIHDMQRRQQWMRDRLIEQGHEELPYVGSVTHHSHMESLANRIRTTLGLDRDWAETCPTWEDALRKLRDAIEEIGILISTSGVVGLNNSRPLDPDEFRGFVLCDRFAPLVFVNGADVKSAQMFTLAHELAHIWLGKDGVFNLIETLPASDETEKFCNRVAAEFLIPAAKLRAQWPKAEGTNRPFQTISNWFKVSPVVVARRAFDLRMIDSERFFSFYRHQQAEWYALKAKAKEKASGGNFYATQNVRLGRRFAHSVIRAVREGQLLYRDAFQLTGLKGQTFDRFAARLTALNEGGAA
jgi:Zn-dependent peptidase ImmA (M78 family)